MLASAALVSACDLGPLGASALRGEPATEPVGDWSFLESQYNVDIQPHADAWLPAARSWFVVEDGVLWLYAMSTDLEPPWLARLRDDPSITLGVDGRLYEARATLVTDPARLEPLLPRVLAKYHLVETPRARFVPHPERFPDTQIHHWFFAVVGPPAG